MFLMSFYHYFRFSGFRHSSSGTTKMPSLRISNIMDREIHVLRDPVCRGGLQRVRHGLQCFEHVEHDLVGYPVVHVCPHAERPHIRKNLRLEVRVMKHSWYCCAFALDGIVVVAHPEEVGHDRHVYFAQLPYCRACNVVVVLVCPVCLDDVVCKSQDQSIHKLIGRPSAFDEQIVVFRQGVPVPQRHVRRLAVWKEIVRIQPMR